MRPRLRATAAALALLAVPALAVPAAGLMHLRLVRAEPRANATVAAVPAAVRLWFTQSPEAAVTRVRVVGSGGAVDVGPVSAQSDGALAAAIRGPMPPGVYRVEWRTMAADGHAVGGRYAFRLAPAAPAAPARR